ncbi:hypothetical protein A1OU_12440 [Enterovibrio norvegicus]|nr:hypothetical protein A1OU_12440 [Enterovibrio norvegicus]
MDNPCAYHPFETHHTKKSLLAVREKANVCLKKYNAQIYEEAGSKKATSGVAFFNLAWRVN